MQIVRWKRLLVALLLSTPGCTFEAGSVPAGDDRDGSRADAALPADAPPEPGCLDGVFAFVPSNIDRCDIPAAEEPLQVLADGFTTIDTTNARISVNELPAEPLAATLFLAQPNGGPELMVAAFTDIDIAGRLQVLGSRPLLLISLEDVQIRGELLANATGNIAGPGADHALCGAGEAGETQTSANQAPAGSGGGGGSFGEPGGQGPQVMGSTGQPSTSGNVHGSASLIPLTAGCSGGAGGDMGGGEAGGGGGGVQIVAADRFELSGTLSVSGGGGRGATALSAGGGGGGSGGAILVEAQRIVVNGAITANGGGGGEGARGGGIGASGADGDPRGATPALGGSGGAASGGDGGNGGALDVPATSGGQGLADATRAGGSGGGGGGVGRITLRAVEPMDLSGATISPSPSSPR